jgi:hypothetical protein
VQNVIFGGKNGESDEHPPHPVMGTSGMSAKRLNVTRALSLTVTYGRAAKIKTVKCVKRGVQHIKFLEKQKELSANLEELASGLLYMCLLPLI